MKTFKVSGVEYVFRKVDERGNVYGSKLKDGKPTRGRPSHFTMAEVTAENPEFSVEPSGDEESVTDTVTEDAETPVENDKTDEGVFFLLN